MSVRKCMKEPVHQRGGVVCPAGRCPRCVYSRGVHLSGWYLSGGMFVWTPLSPVSCQWTHVLLLSAEAATVSYDNFVQ